MNKIQQKIKDKFIEVTKDGLTDKADYHAYEEVYPFLLDKFIGKKINILEVGTATGGGLRILSELFPDSKIYGIDWDHSRLKIDLKDYPNVEIFCYDQCNPAFLQHLPKLDFVTEDCSHQMSNSLKTFEIIQPILNPGAVYVIEDVYPEFLDAYEEDGRFDMYDAREIKNSADDVLAVYNHPE